jgi:hypothetical protein
MPRKENERGANVEHKMSDETRKQVYGKSEEETAPQDKDRERQTNAPSPAGHPDSHGADRGS